MSFTEKQVRMKQTQAPSTNLSPRKPSKVPEMQMKAKKMQVRKRRNLVIKRKRRNQVK
ncbi:hypothetical protein F2Q69_00047322 [Brassica cretica]|uniref:Uncharacterized protein n=1 Tax=Brassica cretica TaxID=69181 RepID=A0A8S9PYD5_BRACR|nr:hypothetical protein F2Q69_00047322 [Brassica cretica]